MKKMLRKWVAVVLASLMSVSLLGGCTQKKAEDIATTPTPGASQESTEPTTSTQPSTSTEPTTSTEPITINIISNYTDQEAMYQILKENYEKDHQNVTINYDLKGGSDYSVILATQIQAGDAPDLFSHSGITEPLLATMAKQGNAVAMNDYFDASQYPEWLTRMYTVDGKIYSIPGLVEDAMVVFYNKKVFEDNGLSVPKTQEDFTTICDTLVKNGVTPITLPSKSTFDIFMTLSVFMQSYAADWNHDFPFNGKQYTDPEFKSAMNLFASWVDKEYFGNDYQALDANTSVAQLLQGKAAMFMNGAWYAPNFVDSEDIGILFLKRPDGKDAGISSPKQSATLGVCSKSKHVEVAVDVAQYFASPEFQQILANNGDCVPSSFEAAQNITSPNRFMADISKRDNTEMSFVDTQGLIPKDGVDYWSPFLNGLQEVVYQQMTADEFVDTINELFDFSKAAK